MAETAEVKPEGVSSNRRKYCFVIEAGDDLGRNPDFAPLKKRLRGRWGKSVLQHNKGTEALMKMPDMPGIHVEIDMERRAARIFDPLTLPEHKRTVQEAQGPYKQMMGANGEPWQEVVVNKMSDSDMKTWVYWMFRMISDPTPAARLVGGQPPREMSEVEALPGKTRIEQYNASARALKTIEDARAAVLAAGGS